MKRLIVLAFVMASVLTITYGAAADDIYWDFSVPDVNITDKDFSGDYGVPLQSEEETNLYDQRQTPNVEALPEQVPIRTRTPDASTRVQPAETSRQSNTIAPRQPQTLRRPATVTTPKSSETDPGTVSSGQPTGGAVRDFPEKSAGSQNVDAQMKKAVPTPAPELDSQRPTTRRMRWGQVEPKPSEPKPQLQIESEPEAVE